MPRRRHKHEAIQEFILTHIAANPTTVVRLTAEHFGISRQAAHKHVQQLVQNGMLQASGNTKDRHYSLKTLSQTFHYPLNRQLNEDIIWKDDIKPLLQGLPRNVLDLWAYSITEMINNAIDHSGGTQLDIFITQKPAETEIWIWDNGEGIFGKIQRALNLPDPKQAILELKKGKFTTDPEHHSGEGIFFTSRMSDDFTIVSGLLSFFHKDTEDKDWLLERKEIMQGTKVLLTIDNHTSRTAKSVFDLFANQEYDFAKTVIPVHMAGLGEGLVSRSQAKRLLTRVDKFKTVILDFSGVEMIGQGFADEIFRVFAQQHPEVDLVPLYTNDAVSKMISRAVLARK